MSNAHHDGEVIAAPAHDSAFGIRWLLKRFVLAIAILFVGIGGLAWILHASIDPLSDEARAEQGVASR